MKLDTILKKILFISWLVVKTTLVVASIYKLPTMILTTYHSSFDITAFTITVWLLFCALSGIGVLKSKFLLIFGLLMQGGLAICVFMLSETYGFADPELYSGLLLFIKIWWIHFIGQQYFEKSFKSFLDFSVDSILPDLISLFNNFDSNTQEFLENNPALNNILFIFWIITKLILIFGSLLLIFCCFGLFFIYVLMVPFFRIFFLSLFFNLVCASGILKWKGMLFWGLIFQISLIYYLAKYIEYFAKLVKDSSYKSEYGIYKYLTVMFIIWWIHFIGQYCYQKYWKES